jgi:hypothetical protein
MLSIKSWMVEDFKLIIQQLSIAQCYATLTYWITSYDKEEYLADHKTLISSLNTLLNKEHDNFSSWYW